MPTSPPGPERSLLDRLNALKPSSISLSGQSISLSGNTSAASFGSADGKSTSAAPISREDALTARLKSLRRARDESSSSDAKKIDDAGPKSESEGGERKDGKEDVGGGRIATDTIGASENDPLFLSEDQDVNNLLLELAAEHGFGEEDADEDGVEEQAWKDFKNGKSDRHGDDEDAFMLPSVPTGDHLGDSSGDEGGEEDNSEQVEALLRNLAGTHLATLKGDKDHDADSDDSDGDDMDREVRRVLDRVKDEATLDETEVEKEDEDGEEEDTIMSTHKRNFELEDDAILQGETRAKGLRNSKETAPEADDNPLGLPAVPTTFVDPFPSDPDPSSNTPSLPSVPSKEPPKRGGDDDISARLAALRGLRGTAAGLGQTDAFGLPSAPTFRPGEEEGGVLKRGHFGHGRANYTDADRQAWCIVCLEDATVRCLGCAEDERDEQSDQKNAYCVRCWRDMHVGPAAGFDERGHKRVPLVRGQGGG